MEPLVKSPNTTEVATEDATGTMLNVNESGAVLSTRPSTSNVYVPSVSSVSTSVSTVARVKLTRFPA